MFKQLTEQDAGFLQLETPETPQHVGSVSFVELPAGYQGDFFSAYKRHIASRLHLTPMLTQKLMPLPLELDLPFWVDDPALDIDYHVRHATLPQPGSQAQLEALVGQLHGQFLDRSRPLWEFHVINGLASGQLAIYTKVHHAAMDGAASQLLIEVMYDTTPEGRQISPPAQPAGTAQKHDLQAVLRGLASHFARQEIRAVQYVPEALKAWSRLLLPDEQTLNYDKTVLPPMLAPHTLFNVAVTSERAFAARTLQLSRVKRLGKATQAKVNDVVLTLVAGALRRYLQSHNACPKLPMTAMVPVSQHTPGEPIKGNENAALICTLATDVADPYQRLLVIRQAMSDQKRFLNNVKNVLFPDVSVIGGGALVSSIAKLYGHTVLPETLPPLYNLVVSNVPGPPVPLYILGARVLSFNPCSIPWHSTALNITIESYCDSLDFGLTACRRAVPDVAVLADHITAELLALEQAVASQAPPVPAKAAPTPQPQAPAKAKAETKTKAKTTSTQATARTRRSRPTASTHPGEGKTTS